MDNDIPAIKKIAIVGGTGKEGKGLAYRWAKAGHGIIIGSRLKEKADAAVNELKSLLGENCDITAATNPEAVQAADLIVMTVPFGVHKEMLESLKPFVTGKIFVDVTVPLVPPKVTKVQMPPAGSAAQEAYQILGEAVQVVSAFQNISYDHLLKDEELECDVLVCGTSKAAKAVVLDLVKAAGLVGWDAGPIENSVVVEGLTSILIGLNKQFNVLASGIRITGVPRPN
jgi:NADPH-dependent F420 reductase